MTNGPTRREFLGSMAALTVFPLEQEKPELILHNGNIWTVNAAEPRAQAAAIARGRFLAVGSDKDVLNLAVPGAQENRPWRKNRASRIYRRAFAPFRGG
jgi:hypothetical protein